MELYFSDIFEVSEEDLEEYGAFNISLITDLPLFIDPFLLFNSKKPEYQNLHNEIINYLRFLRDTSISNTTNNTSIKSIYYFSEVKQNWLGVCSSGNSGRGLGKKFAKVLDENLKNIFNNFGNENITRGSHLEKLCLIKKGVGKDLISDFTTNLIKDYLLKYTQKFAEIYIKPRYRRKISIQNSIFSHEYKRWFPENYNLPFYDRKGDYVILTPKDLLTKDDIWINRRDIIKNFDAIPQAIDNITLRDAINEYFRRMLPRTPKNDDIVSAIEMTLNQYPVLYDYFIKHKEEHGEEAIKTSSLKVFDSNKLYVKQYGELVNLLKTHTKFYSIFSTTTDEARKRIEYFQDVIENKGGHKLFYLKGKPIRKETDVHIMFRLVWYKTQSNVSREVNDGRGPVDYEISRGKRDKTHVEFKLASNSHLKNNLKNQTKIYQKAGDANIALNVIIYFTEEEFNRVHKILKELNLEHSEDIYLIDARNDNKPSGSKA